MSAYTYHLDEGVLSLPTGFRDVTINVFEWVDATGRCTLTVQREQRRAELTFDQMVALTTESYPKKFAAYAAEDPMDIALDVPAVSKRFRWHSKFGVSYNHQVFIDLDTSLLLITASGDAALMERVDDVLHQVLSGFRLRERG